MTITKSKILKTLATVAMAFGSSGVPVYAEDTPAPSATPTVTEATPEATATATDAPTPTPTATPKATIAPSASASAEATATPKASTDPTPTATADPVEVSPWLSDWAYSLDPDTLTVTISEYLPEAPLVDGHPDVFGWDVDVVVPATATVTKDGTAGTYQTVLAPRLSTKETMASVSSLSFEQGVKMSADSSYLFASFKAASIDCRGLDTTGVMDLSHAFSNWGLQSINLSGLDLSGVANMDGFIGNAQPVNYITAPAKLPDGFSQDLPGTVSPEYEKGWGNSFYKLNDDGSVDESAAYTTLESIPANTTTIRRIPAVVWFGGMKLSDYNTAMESATDTLSAVTAYDNTIGSDIPAGTYRLGLYRDAKTETDLGTLVETLTIDVADDRSASCTLTRDGNTVYTKSCKVGVLNDGSLTLADLPTFEDRYMNSNYLILMLDPDGNPLTSNMAPYTDNGNIIHFVQREGAYAKIDGLTGFAPTDKGRSKSAAVRGIAYEPDTAATITFDPGYDGAAAVTEDTTQGASINLSDHAIERDGYMLIGWSDGTSEHAFNGTYTVPSDTHAATLTAIWKEISSSVSVAVDYKANGGNRDVSVLNLPLDLSGIAMTSDNGGILSGDDSTRAFGTISINAYGTQTYTITPGTPNLADYVLDDASTHTITVTADHDETSPLFITLAIDGGEPKTIQSVSVAEQDGKVALASSRDKATLTGTYTLSYQEPTPAEDKINVLVNKDNSPMSGASVVVDDKDVKATSNDGTAVYDVTHASEGTVSYTVRQNLTAAQKADKNMTYDETVYTVTYTTHRGSADETAAEHHTLVSDVVIKTDAGFVTDKVVFNNYSVPADPSDVSLTGTVTFDNAFHKVDSFPFEILDENGNQIERVDSIDGGFKFADLHYDAEGTHTYTVQQIVGNDETINYDASVYAVTVVTKRGRVDGKDTYISTVTLKKDGKDADKIAFANTTKAAEPLKVTETAKGDDGSKITFNADIKTVRDGEATHSDTFKDSGTYTIVVKQDLTDDQLADENWNYDKSVYTITYTVTRDGNSLSETHVITDADGNVVDAIVFHNKHNDPKPSWTILSGTVTIDNEKRIAQGLDPINSFEVDMYDENGKLVESVDSVDGKFKFSPLSYFAEGTHTYTIRQKSGDDPTVEYSDVVYTVTLNTTLRDNTPKLNEYYDAISINASIHGQKPAGAEFIQFANVTYEPNPVEFNMKGTVLRNSNAPTAETFDFTATHDKSVTTVKSVKDLVDFEKMKVSAPGTYTFTLTQTPGTIKSLKYDTSVYTAKVVVTRKGNDLSYEITYRDADGNSVDHPAWNNVTADAFKTIKSLDVSEYFSGKVVLNDKAPTCSCFDFTLSESNTRTLATVKGPLDYTGWSDEIDPNEVKLVGGTISRTDSAYRKDSVIQAVKNNNGTVDFSGITVDHDGTYTFTMKEVKGNNANINYGTDDTYVVTLKVSRDWKTGALTVDSSEIRKNGTVVKDSDVVFTNTTKTAYQAAKASAAPTATPSATPTATATPAANATASTNPKSGANGYAGYIPGFAMAAVGIVVLLVVKRKANTVK